MRNEQTIMVGKPEGKRPLRKPGRTLDNNIKLDLKEAGWKDVDWIHLTWDNKSSMLL
jgi:hypothetical protein